MSTREQAAEWDDFDAQGITRLVEDEPTQDDLDYLNGFEDEADEDWEWQRSFLNNG